MLTPLSMTVEAADGLILRGTLRYPSARPPAGGFPLAVLAHQYPATRDSFAPLVADLLELSVASLAFDQRGHGESINSPDGPRVINAPADFEPMAFFNAFVTSITKIGFNRIDDDIVRVTRWGSVQNYIDPGRILLAGASVGGSGVMLAGPRIGAPLRGTVTFGAAGAPAWGEDASARIRHIIETVRAPCLLTSSEGDAFDGAANVHNWGHGLSHVQSVIVPGSDHAMAIYFDVREQVRAFIRAVII
ncbi:MAG: alpha/beta hydrolase [Gemmatimonadota bacterium]